MKNNHIIRHLRALSACAALLLLTACQQEQDGLSVDIGRTGDPVQIGFTLTTTGGQDAAATRVGTDEPGTGYENYIDIANDNFRFLLFDATNNTYLTSFTPQSVTPAGQGTRGYEYYVEGELDQPYENFKLVVLANWPGYPQDLEGKTIANVCTSPSSGFRYSPTDANPFIPSATDLIPLYGVKTVTAKLRPDLSTDLGTVDLLRAMCKVEVKCSAEGFTLTDVKLHRYAIAGMCAPTDVYSNTETDWDEKIHMPTGNIVSDGGVLSLQSSGNNAFVVYMPEINNTADTHSYMEVTLQNAEGEAVSLKGDPYIFFKQYDATTHTPTDGTDFDLIRNHWYQYDITAVDDGQLTFEYRVLEWNRVDSQIGWYPEEGTGENALMAAWPSDYSSDPTHPGAMPNFENATEGDQEAVFCYLLYPRYKNKQHNSLEDNSAFAGFYFHLEEPEGAIWEAELTNTEDFRLNENGPYDSDDDGVQDSRCVASGRARSKPYQIQVRANHAWTEPRYDGDDQYWNNNTVWGNAIEESGECKNIYTDLRIRISIDGGQTWNYLDINKEDRNVKYSLWGRRRFAGGDDYIRIWQLKAEEDQQNLFRLVMNLSNDWGIHDFWYPNVSADDF